MKTIKEINEKLKKGKAVVLTASEVKKLADEKKPSEIAAKVDIVTFKDAESVPGRCPCLRWNRSG
jgi:uncharacterized protein (DUF39 family)